MAEATTTSTSSSTPSTSSPHSAPEASQVILQSSRDTELQPDALRGSEHLIKDLLADGTIKDLEADRAETIAPTKGPK